jgi:GNAT superfamily N-acetyltransferase
MVEHPGFLAALERNLARGSAVVARDRDLVVGGLLFPHQRPPRYAITWLVVDDGHRDRGVGRALVGWAVRRWVETPGVVEVLTFAEGHPGARARRFYEALGFEPAEVLEDPGGVRQVMRLHVAALPSWAIDQVAPPDAAG